MPPDFSGWTSADLLDLGKLQKMEILFLLNLPANLIIGGWIRRLPRQLTVLVIYGEQRRHIHIVDIGTTLTRARVGGVGRILPPLMFLGDIKKLTA